MDNSAKNLKIEKQAATTWNFRGKHLPACWWSVLRISRGNFQNLIVASKYAGFNFSAYDLASQHTESVGEHHFLAMANKKCTRMMCNVGLKVLPAFWANFFGVNTRNVVKVFSVLSYTAIKFWSCNWNSNPDQMHNAAKNLIIEKRAATTWHFRVKLLPASWKSRRCFEICRFYILQHSI